MPDSAADIERQIEYYLRKYELAPHSRAFAPLADLYRKAGRVEEALEILAAGLVEHPQYVSALVINGRCHLDAGHADAATRSFRRVLELDPDNLVALKQLAALALGEGDAATANDLLARVVVLDPTDEASAAQLEALRSGPAEPASAPREAPTPAGETSAAVEAAAAPAEPAPRLEPSAAPPEATAPEPAPQDTTPAEPTPTDVTEPELAPQDTMAAVAIEPVPADATPAAGEDHPEGAAAAPAGGRESSFVTKTLAEIYLAQGYRDKALHVLRQILARHPERADVRTRLAELESEPAQPEPVAPPAVEAAPDGSTSRRHFEAWLQRLSRPEESE
jgi:tetratricopeptide (TPR) repeat protein